MFQYAKDFRVRNPKTSRREGEAENDVMRQVIKAGVGMQSRTALVWRFIFDKYGKKMAVINTA
jgi:hypothetical protein